MFGVSMILIGFITHVWQFFIVYSVMLALTSSIAMVPLMAAVNPWFKRRLGLGIGLMWAGRRRWRGGVGPDLLAVAGQLRLDRHLCYDRSGRRRSHPGLDAVFSATNLQKRDCWPTERQPPIRRP